MKKKTENLLMFLGGTLVGIINGFFGGGGGMLCVPLLERVLKLETKKSHATAILIMLPISIASAVIYIINGYFHIFNALYVSGGVVFGGLMGALLLKKLNSKIIGLIFSLIMIGVGLKLIFF